MTTTRLPSAVVILGLSALVLWGCGEGESPPPDEAPAEAPALPGLPGEPEAVSPEAALDPAPDPEAPPSADTLPPPPPSDDTMPTPPREESGIRTEEGVIGVTGTDAWSLAVLRTRESGSIGLTGELEPELRRLGGLPVRVEGRHAATAVGPGIEVTSYRLLEVDGRVPLLGILRRGDGGGWLLEPADAEAPIPLAGLPGDRLQAGMKIWVLGPMGTDGRLAVESYGIVAPAGG